MTVPYVIETDEKNNDRVYDLYSRLLKDRIIFIRGTFEENMSNSIVAQLLFLESQDAQKDIYMYIDSHGGELGAMYAIFDTMQYVRPEICTIGIGKAMSAGSFILAAGTKGKRFALPNAQIMIHELASGTQGKVNEIVNEYNHVMTLYEKMANYYVEFTGQPLKKIKRDMQKDFYMTAEEAKKYGLVDEVHYRRG